MKLVDYIQKMHIPKNTKVRCEYGGFIYFNQDTTATKVKKLHGEYWSLNVRCFFIDPSGQRLEENKISKVNAGLALKYASWVK